MGMLREFKEFATKGNVVDLAVAVVLGGAFGAVVTSLTEAFIMPLISMVLGKEGMSGIAFTVGDTVFPVGKFIQALINFLLIAFVLFLVIKGINSLKKKEAPAPAATPEDIQLLREIRDALKNR
ncbi:MAG TPA: large conductance mechanosensitive channel protein MscL [Chitinophagaceae bacterium]|nr:large conductance mechanosensitive channel protein MscL [Chitinophagaceae bacterium]